jgi:transcription antitermination factor NusG
MSNPARIPLREWSWYVVMTAPQREFDAAAGMRRAGYYTWLPYVIVKKTVKRANSNLRRVIELDRAYYERYVFVGCKYEGQDLSGLRGVSHVSCLVKSPLTGKPLQIPDAVMDRIVALGDGTEFVREIDELTKPKRRKYGKGEAVGLNGTPFDRFVALVEQDLGAVVWVEVEGLRVSVKPEQIEAKAA